MRSVRLEDLAGLLGARFGPGTGGVPAGGPRVVASGNFATPLTLLALVDGALPSYRLNVLNAQPGLPTRDGVRARDVVRRAGHAPQPRAALRADPALARAGALRDHAAARRRRPAHLGPRRGTVSLGIEVNVLPAAIEAVARPRRPGHRADEPRRCRTPSATRSSPSTWSTCAVEVDEPLPAPGGASLDDASRLIGERLVGAGAATARPCSSASAPSRTPCCPG